MLDGKVNGVTHDQGWEFPRAWPGLAGREALVWLAHLPAVRPHLARLTASLSLDERERAARFRTDDLRVNWQLARGLLRTILSRYCGLAAGDIRFDLNAHGKPGLAVGPAAELFFNVSHSGEYAAFALTRAGRVGVDIETMRERMPQAMDIAQRYFAPEETEFLRALAGPDRPRGFFRLWTFKEAFVKARGDGLFSGLSRFAISLEPEPGLSVEGRPALDWNLRAFPETSGLAGAIAVEARSVSFRFHRWTDELTG